MPLYVYTYCKINFQDQSQTDFKHIIVGQEYSTLQT